MTKSRKYICYWDCLGFECIVDLTNWERKSLLDTIAGNELESPPVSLHALIMRARFNPQRNPEIWTFNTEPEMTEKDLWYHATENPQALVNLIRENGKNIYKTPTINSVIK